jgi:DNA-binding protein HU-beta
MKNVIDAIASGLETTKKDAKTIIELVFKKVVEQTKIDKVKISGVGTFKVKDKAARKARNPKTGESIDVPAKTVLTFKATKDALES